MILDETLFEKININNIPDKNKNGDCYQQAYRYVTSHPTATLVHGIVVGRGPIEGIEYNHAWAEENGNVIDKTMNLELPIDAYYALGQVRLTYKYSIDELYKKSLEYKTYGPWEDELW